MTSPFWFNNPYILFNKEHVFELWPINRMLFDEKLNAISRLVIILTLLGYLVTKKNSFVLIGFVTLLAIVLIYKFRKQNIVQSLQNVEGFKNKTNKRTTNPVTLANTLRSEFHPTTKKNPMGNVLLTDIMDTPNRLAAAPAFNPDVCEDINNAVKKQTQMLNPTIINTNKQIYGDLKDSYDLDMSMRNFYSTPNTRVTNDQGAFAQFLYGNMPSGKSSGPDGAFARVQDNARYIIT